MRTPHFFLSTSHAVGSLALIVQLSSGATGTALAEQPITAKQRSWWAFQPMADPSPPQVSDGGWACTDIDRFVFSEIVKQGLPAAPPADRRAWLRRAKFALIGLPPTPEEIDSFIDDSSPDAFVRAVDGWLKSPHFGEHWGRYWLDVVRYTDYLNNQPDDAKEEGDVELFEAYRYRDWVVDALNHDMPFNDFAVHQIAGEQLPAVNGEEVYADGLIATTLLSIGVWDNGDADKEKIVSDIVDDQINVVGQAFLGLTLACARCHDHKFDPISTEDYYGLAGMFYSTRVLKALGPVGLSTVAMRVPLVPRAYLAQREAQLARINEIDTLLKSNSLGEPGIAKLPTGNAATAAAAVPLTPEQRTLLEQEREQLKQVELRPPPTALAVQDGGTPGGLFPRNGDVPVHVGGRYDQLGATIPRRLPTFFCGENQAPITSGSGRMELATWIASPDNPLTPRVIVNRVWQKLFGQGLVGTPNNFGLLGETPSHPELLDWLSRRFVEHQWSLKWLIREIMRSSVYQQATLIGAEPSTARAIMLVDPTNRWLSRFSSRRLTAEELRDSILAAAGRLDTRIGGRATSDLNRPRRSLYIQTVRADRRNFSTLFDAADPSQCVGRRNITTVAPQSLFMLNNAFVVENAKQVAAKLDAESSTDESVRIHRAYTTLLGRPPTAQELSIAREFVAAAQEHDAASAWTEFAHLLLCTSEFCYVD